ncbi:hypothetical protein CsSME_00016849 [Camellia sinensis var. sinensis]
MIKAKAELNNIVGPNKKMEESDINHLQYLQAVVKETLRLHPPFSFLLLRKTIHNTNFMGYHAPKNTQVFINAWEIGRDPECWDEPMSFKPERFIGSKIDYKGQHSQLIPSGAKRRMCAGTPLGHRMLHLLLGSLLQESDWKLQGHVNGVTMDMKEKCSRTPCAGFAVKSCCCCACSSVAGCVAATVVLLWEALCWFFAVLHYCCWSYCCWLLVLLVDTLGVKYLVPVPVAGR